MQCDDTMKSAKAFTLIEIMLVCGVIILVVGIMFPVVVQGIRAAHRTATISNLKQCGTALAMYCEEYGGTESMPEFDSVVSVLAKMPTCDPEDYLRADCRVNFGKPLIGSYAYVRGLSWTDTQQEWDTWLAIRPDPYLLASVYYGDRRVVPFDGNELNRCLVDFSCAMPSRLIRTRQDTSVLVRTLGFPRTSRGGIHFAPFTWEEVFVKE